MRRPGGCLASASREALPSVLRGVAVVQATQLQTVVAGRVTSRRAVSGRSKNHKVILSLCQRPKKLP